MNIWEARRSSAGTIQGSIERCERDGLFNDQDEDEALLMWIDYKKLRGLPAIGKGVSGHPTDSFVPGSDEHLEQIA